MLVLTRRIGEKIIIADNVKVSIMGVKGHQVRIGIEAPDDVEINREEIYQRHLKEEKTLSDTRRVGNPADELAEIRKAITGVG